MNLDRIGKYRIVGKIGQGAMGEVYKAHDPLLNRYVALKTISPSLAADSEFRERFKREAQSAARLNHPNIVTVFDFGEESGLTYMAMELLEGLDLREALRRRSLGHLGRKLEVMVQLCDGLAFAHSQGVVHRDLKPGNVHIQPTGHVKVLDFGLARLGTSDITRTGTVMGTPHYMSPEQVRGERADARSDVFSLGALFYEILSGHRAFEGGVVAEVLQAIVKKEPEPLRRRVPDVPAALVPVVERALAKSPDRRFQDAGEMGQALGRARDSLAGETLAGPGSGGRGRAYDPDGGGRDDGARQRRACRPVGRGGERAGPRPGRREPADVTTPRCDPSSPWPPGPRPRCRPGRAASWSARSFSSRRRSPGSASGCAPAPAPPSPPDAGGRRDGRDPDRDPPDEQGRARPGRPRQPRLPGGGRPRPRSAGHRRRLRRRPGDPRAGGGRRRRSSRSRPTRRSPRSSRATPRAPPRPSAGCSRSTPGTRSRTGCRSSSTASSAARPRTRAARPATPGPRPRPRGPRARPTSAAPPPCSPPRTASPGASSTPSPRRSTSSRGTPSKWPAPPRKPGGPPASPRRRPRSSRASCRRRRRPWPPRRPRPPRRRASTPLPTPSVAAMVPTPSPSAPLPAAPAADTRIAEIERVLAGYERAYETLDVAALRSVMDLGADQEKKLREAFKAFKSYDVEMSGHSVEFEGDGSREGPGRATGHRQRPAPARGEADVRARPPGWGLADRLLLLRTLAGPARTSSRDRPPA